MADLKHRRHPSSETVLSSQFSVSGFRFLVSLIRSVEIVRNGFSFRDEEGLHAFRFH
jgi:hypothetical protein